MFVEGWMDEDGERGWEEGRLGEERRMLGGGEGE